MNSALQRARASMRDAGTRELVRRYIDASMSTDIDALAALLRDDVRCSMPPRRASTSAATRW